MLFKNQEKQENLLKIKEKKPKGACQKEMWQQEVYYN